MAKKKTPEKLSDLTPDDKNFNIGSEYGNHLLGKSLSKLGAGRSILIDKNNRIISGNKTVENAAAIGMEDVIVVESDGKKLIAVKRTDIDLDSPEGREMALADNAVAKANIVFDAELTEAVVTPAVMEEWGIETNKKIEAEDDNFEGAPPKNPITILGDIYELGEHRLLCGDCGNIENLNKLFGNKKADLVFTDPPYGVSIGAKNRMLNSFQPSGRNLTDITDDEATPEELKVILTQSFSNLKSKLNDCCAVFVTAPQGGGIGMMMMMMMMDAGMPIKHVLIWLKNSPTFSMGRLDYDYKHEPILMTWLKSHKRKKEGKFQTSIWEADKPRANKEHPTMKPIAIPENAILNHSDIGDIVADIYLGSGTTLIAAEQLKRICYGTEIMPNYCDVTIARYINHKKLKSQEIKITRNGLALSPKEIDAFIENTNADK